MAVIEISLKPLVLYEGEWVGLFPRRGESLRKIRIEVPDEVVDRKQIQTILDTYALTRGKPEWVGKNMDWHKNNQQAELVFHLVLPN